MAKLTFNQNDLKKFQRKMETEVRNSIKSDLQCRYFDVECPKCKHTFKALPGKNICPKCKCSVNLNIDLNF